MCKVIIRSKPCDDGTVELFFYHTTFNNLARPEQAATCIKPESAVFSPATKHKDHSEHSYFEETSNGLSRSIDGADSLTSLDGLQSPSQLF